MGCFPCQRGLVRDDLEVAGPLLTLLARVETCRELNPRGEWPLLLRRGGVVEDDVVDEQLGGRVSVELDVVDAFILRERAARAVGTPGHGHVHGHSLPPL